MPASQQVPTANAPTTQPPSAPSRATGRSANSD
jgi:hypothetical protein